VGYAWCFPLSTNEYHLGCGSLLYDPRKFFNELGWLKYGTGNPDGGEILCGCPGTVRLTAPHYSLPHTTVSGTTEIWGTGEAIGCVAPLAGDGIVPGMRSVQLLLEHWDDPVSYTRAVMKEFSWMQKERKVIDKLRFSKPLGIRDAMVLKQNSKRMKMDVSIKNAIALLQNLKPRKK
jgi:flavin-dependent dehydrogenase